MLPAPSILLVDDDIDDQEIFTSALAFIDPSIVCSIVPNGMEGIRLLKNAVLMPDLVFLDLNMPLMNGIQFLKEAKGISGVKDVPVIIYSTASDIRTIEEAKQAGAHQFITKPEKFSELVGLLHELLYPATK